MIKSKLHSGVFPSQSSKDIHREIVLLPWVKHLAILFVEVCTIILLSGCDGKGMRKNVHGQLVLRKQRYGMQIIRLYIIILYCQSKASFICGLIFYICENSPSSNWPSILFLSPHSLKKLNFEGSQIQPKQVISSFFIVHQTAITQCDAFGSSVATGMRGKHQQT